MKECVVNCRLERHILWFKRFAMVMAGMMVVTVGLLLLELLEGG